MATEGTQRVPSPWFTNVSATQILHTWPKQCQDGGAELDGRGFTLQAPDPRVGLREIQKLLKLLQNFTHGFSFFWKKSVACTGISKQSLTLRRLKTSALDQLASSKPHCLDTLPITVTGEGTERVPQIFIFLAPGKLSLSTNNTEVLF